MEGSRLTYVVVQQGETLAELSERYRTSVEELARLNGGLRQVESGDVIKVGEETPQFREPRAPTRHVLGFYTGPMGAAMPGSAASFERHARLLSSVAPYWFDLDRRAPGQIKPRVSPTIIRELVESAHRRGVKILASIHNTDQAAGTTAADTLSAVMRSHRNTFYRNLFSLINEYQFDGVNLDFEQLRDEDRALYTEFVRELSERAHSQGKLVTVDVLGDARKVPYSLDFDYPGLAQSVDYLGIMTYDQYKPTEAAPGPVAALPWVRDTLAMALEDGVPPRKILLGIPFYGYDWTIGKAGARALSHEAVEKLRAEHGGVVKFHPTYKVPYMVYTDKSGRNHEVWFENARSISMKLDLVRRYNLGGVIIWRLGLEDPTAWSAIRAKLSPIE